MTGMPFSALEREKLLGIKGVGPTVITRLEQIGIDSFDLLARAEANAVVQQVSESLSSTCWRNSPQAKAAIQAANHVAKGTQ